MNELSSMLVPLMGSFPGWPTSEQPSAAMVLLILIGIPVGVCVVLGVIAGAGTLATRGRGDSTKEAPIWIGYTLDGSSGRPALSGGHGGDAAHSTDDRELEGSTGGTSVRW